ncbi:hypothetical protein LSH36_184g01023 [Paralvinella palmiformis]|uniref:UDENN domain-containing protein n=1 Tax=Paralvinella palmiformis TaxID=53620 RepID=A0AAD9N5G9_9ANNE|nr:hypothetical protein LSH36_184g01023 [Paralvinella palmiformis]
MSPHCCEVKRLQFFFHIEAAEIEVVRIMETVYNHLVEMVIAVGINEVTGLSAAEPQPPPLFHHENKLFCTAFDTQILAAISNHVAVFPLDAEPHDPNYPPQTDRTRCPKYDADTQRNKRNIYKTWTTSKGHSRTPGRRKHTKNYSGSLHGRSSSFCMFDFAHQAAASKSLSLKAADLPLNAETLQSIVTICFPDGAYVKDEEQSSSVHYLVLTDVTGDHSYAICVTLYQAYTATKFSIKIMFQCLEDDRWQCSRYYDRGEGRGLDHVIYVPLCLVTISKQPYFTVLHDCLSKLAEHLKSDEEEWKSILKEFTLHLTSVPIPPCVALSISFQLLQEIDIEVTSTEYPGIMASDFPLYLAFLHLTLDDIILLLTAILTEQRLVFLSAHQSLLVLVCQVGKSLQHLIYPFKWLHPYVPLLSWNLIELVEAPGTYIMGCHSRHQHLIEKVEGLVTVDLDIGEVKVCPSLNVPAMPSAPVKVFTVAIHQARRHIDWLTSSRATVFTYQSYRTKQNEHCRNVNKLIQMACIELMSNLFREVFLHTNKEKRFFHKEQFLEGLDTADKPFYEMVLQTDLFGEFLKGLLSPSHSGCRRSQTLSTLSTQISFVSERSESKVLSLPPFVYGLNHLYVDNCLLEVDKVLKSDTTADIRGACAYLRGVYLASQNKRTQALEAFCEVESYNSRLFPLRFVADILSSLSDDEKKAVYGSFMYQQSVLLKEAEHFQKDQTNMEQTIIMELSEIPEADIDQQGFTELVQLLFDLIPDREATNRLFDALTLGERTVVDPYTFEEFYKSWKENQLMLQQVKIPADLLDPEEILLKVSDMCKCSCGTGRLALTPKRLFFLHGGSRKYREVIQLHDIKHVSITQQRSLLKPISALKIVHNDDKVKSFTATLKGDSLEWRHLLNEMWAGRLLAREMQNPNTLDKAAQNVLLMNAFIQSGRSEFANHNGYELEEVESLSFFYQERCCKLNLAPEMKFLHHDLDPSGPMQERTGVMTILYTAGLYRGSTTQDCEPCLWCGLENGKLLIYNAINWTLEIQLTLSSEKLTCLVAVQDKVWVGSADGNIYTVKRRTKSTSQTLSNHDDTVMDFTTVDNDRTIAMEIPNQPGSRVQLDCFLITAQNEIWLGVGQLGQIVIYYGDTLEQKHLIHMGRHSITNMVLASDQIWVGSEEGHLFVYSSFSHKLEMTFYAHKDSITALCTAADRYVMASSGKRDGTVSMWRTNSTFV